jgi:hypothetical protein
MWVDHDGAAYVERGIDLEAFLETARARQDELRASWQPLGKAFAALLAGVRR